MRDRNRRKLIIYGLLISLFVTTVAYAAISTTLDIVGNVSRKGGLWNIYFANLSEPELTGDASSAEARINSTTFNFGANLYQPGDSVTYTLNVKNGGTIDAKLSSMSVQAPDNLEERNLEYIITYADGNEITNGDSLKSGDSKTIKVVLKFKDSATSLPSTDTISNFSFTLIYIQHIPEQTTPGGTTTPGITSNNVIAQIYGNSIQNGTPSPTNPVEIQSVGDKTINLFNKDAITGSSYTINGNDISVKIITSNSSSSTGVTLRQLCPEIEVGQTYRISYITDGGGYISVGSYSSGNAWYSGSTRTITETDLNATVRMGGGSTASTRTVTFSDVQVQKGNLGVAYEPYGKYKIQIIVNGNAKNLFRTSDNEYGTLLVADGSVYSSYKWASTSDFIFLKAGTYTISYKSGINLRNVVLYNQNKEIESYFWSNRANPYTFKIDRDYFVRFDFERADNVNIENINTFFSEYEVQLEEGEVSTSYEPYINPVVNIYLDEPLRKVGDYADYLDLQTGTVTRYIYKKTLNGTESWGLPGTIIDGYSSYRIVGFFPTTTNLPFLSNYFKTLPNTYYSTHKENVATSYPNSNQLIINISNDVANSNSQTTLENWKNWLTDKGLYVLYPLAQPTTETVSVSEFPELSGNITYSIGTTVQPSVVNYGTRN